MEAREIDADQQTIMFWETFGLRHLCQKVNGNWAEIGHLGATELPLGIEEGSQEAKTYLAGEEFFTVQELEIFRPAPTREESVPWPVTDGLSKQTVSQKG